MKLEYITDADCNLFDIASTMFIDTAGFVNKNNYHRVSKVKFLQMTLSERLPKIISHLATID